jgi:hypothetical protein
MKRKLKILASIILLPLLIIEVTVKELYRAWCNMCIITDVKWHFKIMINSIKE